MDDTEKDPKDEETPAEADAAEAAQEAGGPAEEAGEGRS